MKVMWVMGAGERRLIVDFIATSMTVGIGNLEGYVGLVPTIMLSYSLEQLKVFLPALQEMKTLRLVPKVHIWNRTKKRPGPEVRVEFRIPVAGRELLGLFAEDLYRVMDNADDMAFTAELCVASAGNSGRDATENFLRVFRRTRQAVVVVNEEEDSFVTAHKHEIGTPVGVFLVSTIGTVAPPPIELS